jgi:hypothetical protein
MGSYRNTAASGQGSASLGGVVNVNEFLADLVTAGDYVHFNGSSPVRRIHNAGWVGLSEPYAGITRPIIVWKTFIENESEDKPVIFTIGNPPDTIWWDFTPGTVVDISVWW